MECMCAQTRPWFVLLSERVLENRVRTPRKKTPLPETQRRVEPVMLRHAGQGTQHTTD